MDADRLPPGCYRNLAGEVVCDGDAPVPSADRQETPTSAKPPESVVDAFARALHFAPTDGEETTDPYDDEAADYWRQEARHALTVLLNAGVVSLTRPPAEPARRAFVLGFRVDWLVVAGGIVGYLAGRLT